MSRWPISFDDVLAAERRIRPHLAPTPLRHYPALDRVVGHGIRVLVKHENHNPTNSFKARNGLAVLTGLSVAAKRRGVVAATRGNHGQGVAWAGRLLGVPVTICVPVGNNPEKNEAMRDLGAEVIERGRDYDESVDVAQALLNERELVMVHSTNNRHVIAGAATITLEALGQCEDIEAMVVAIGGGSQSVGALSVVRERAPGVDVYGIQAAAASAIHDSWHAGRSLTNDNADTFADGLATRSCYEMTFEALQQGLRDFVVASEAELADAVRVCMRTTHNLAEGAGAAGLAGLRLLAPRLAGKTVAIILSGANIDERTLDRIISGEL
jgi:threonine dehydratase